MKTTEGNKLIAEFMGMQQGKNRPYNDGRWENDWFEAESGMRHSILLYHSSWDWLMPVVEKIENVYTKKYKSGFVVRIEYKDIFVMTLDTSEELIICDQSDSKLEGVYWTCVKFIKWYNKNK